jgi:hypothetical protein
MMPEIAIAQWINHFWTPSLHQHGSFCGCAMHKTFLDEHFQFVSLVKFF